MGAIDSTGLEMSDDGVTWSTFDGTAPTRLDAAGNVKTFAPWCFGDVTAGIGETNARIFFNAFTHAVYGGPFGQNGMAPWVIEVYVKLP